MKRPLATLATLACALAAPALAKAQPVVPSDPIGALISVLTGPADHLKATLYHGGQHGMSARDSLGCPVVPMRTAAVDGISMPRRTILFIKETVGLTMPDGTKHDGYWYASDVGPAIHVGHIDLFTGHTAGTMALMMPLNLTTLTVVRTGVFQGCPPAAAKAP
jgi:3D (Asp-Asp-Asp) domain-containing protein